MPLSLMDSFMYAKFPFGFFEPKGAGKRSNEFVVGADINALLRDMQGFAPLSDSLQKQCLSYGYMPSARFPAQRELIRHGVNDRTIATVYMHVLHFLSAGNVDAVRVDTDGAIKINPVHFPRLGAVMGEQRLGIFLNWLGKQIPKKVIGEQVDIAKRCIGASNFSVSNADNISWPNPR